MNLFIDWFKRTFSNPQVVILGLFLIGGLVVVIGLGRWLAPMFAAIVIAYLLEGIVARLRAIGLSRFPAVLIVFVIFLAILFFLLFGLVPMLSRQLTQLVQQLPNYISQGQALLKELPVNYPQLVSEEQVQAIITSLGDEVARVGQVVLSWSLASVASFIVLVVYVVLVPVLVFFLLKDKHLLFNWAVSYLPRDHHLASVVWAESELQIANYVRGKVTEILIVGAATYITFKFLGLQYSALLATLVGFSVLIPYIGAAVVTIPIAFVAFFQYGWGWDFGQILIAYAVIQALDGNLLVPLLFSEVVDLHPIAIILAILVFGGLWGFWGIFFAIPLATVVNAILRSWPKHHDESEESQDGDEASAEDEESEPAV